MRLATILPENSETPVAAVSVDAQNWVGLYPFLAFFSVKNLPAHSEAPLADFLPLLMPRFSELTRKVSDWPEHGRIFRKRGGKTLRAHRLLPPILQPPSFRDFYAFEQHVKTSRARRGFEMIQAWYEIPVFYFSNPNSLIGHEADVFTPAGSSELDYELEIGAVIGNRGRNVRPETAWNHVAGFTIINDFTARDLQRAEMAVGLGPAKGKDFATAIGPVLVTRDADLFPGDLIGSGTVGTGCILELGPENTGGWLKAGDLVELEIERIGTLGTKVTARPG